MTKNNKGVWRFNAIEFCLQWRWKQPFIDFADVNYMEYYFQVATLFVHDFCAI